MLTAASKNIKANTLLKRKGGGLAVLELLRSRLRQQIAEPKTDKLTAAVIHGLWAVLPTFNGTLLDVGCHAGWLYHFVKAKVDYHGIDNYPEAIKVAKEFFPAERFSVEDLLESKRTADIVWATQLHPEINVVKILPKLSGMAKRRVFWTGCDGQGLFKKVHQHGIIYEGVK